MKLGFLHKYPFTLKQDTILKRKYQLVKQYKILMPTKEDWCMPGKIASPNVNIWTQTGQELATAWCRCYEPRDNHREYIPMGSLSTALQAEVMAVLKCTELLLSKNINRRRIRICSDSRAAIAALAKTPPY